jgi:hypothetical protein
VKAPHNQAYFSELLSRISVTRVKIPLNFGNFQFELGSEVYLSLLSLYIGDRLELLEVEARL